MHKSRPFTQSGKSFIWIWAALAILLVSGCVTMEVEEKPFEPPVFPPPPDPPRFVWDRTIQSSVDVVEEDTTESFRRMVTGENRSGEGFRKPYGIAVHKGRIFVGDSVNRTIFAFDFPERRFFKVGDDDGPGMLLKPLGLATDGSGNLYIVDASARNLKVYSRDGEYITTVAKKGDLDRPTGVAVSKDGSKVYIVDTGGVRSPNHRVRVYEVATGEHLFDIGKRGTGDGEFNLPNNATRGPTGNILVVDGGNFRIQEFTPNGVFVKSIGGIGRQFGQFSRPKGIGVDSEGNIYVADAAFGNFQIFDPQGRLLLFVGARGDGGPAKYFLPAGLAVDDDGRVYIVDQFYRKVGVFRPANVDPGTGYFAPIIKKK
ncbi:hypothetical protein MNBD_NITROSPINAE04-1552 [hydrothermal vent metagenome]|uniref:NHL repeat domain protein n=1 Tax=hydrothermal vent metagenome TaxID=652676 RepID=A0A3B1CCQ4_9ZZZZ